MNTYTSIIAAITAVMPSLIIIPTVAQAGTLSPCASRYNNETTRCYEESNGCFNYQSETLSSGCPKENYWGEGQGVRAARTWCHNNGGTWLAPRPSERLGERCSY